MAFLCRLFRRFPSIKDGKKFFFPSFQSHDEDGDLWAAINDFQTILHNEHHKLGWNAKNLVQTGINQQPVWQRVIWIKVIVTMMMCEWCRISEATVTSSIIAIRTIFINRPHRHTLTHHLPSNHCKLFFCQNQDDFCSFRFKSRHDLRKFLPTPLLCFACPSLFEASHFSPDFILGGEGKQLLQVCHWTWMVVVNKVATAYFHHVTKGMS